MMEKCIHCNQNPRFQYRGKTYNLCAVCGWHFLQTIFRLTDDESKTPEQKVTEAVSCIPVEE